MATLTIPMGASHFASEPTIDREAQMMDAFLNEMVSQISANSSVSANANHMIERFEPSSVPEPRLSREELFHLIASVAARMNRQQAAEPDYRPAQDLADLLNDDAQGRQFLEELGTVVNPNARTGPRVVDYDFMSLRHGQSLHNIKRTDAIDTHLTRGKGDRQVHSTCNQVMDAMAAARIPKPDLVLISALERCKETISPLLEAVNSLTSINGVAQETTKAGYWMAIREILNPGASGNAGPSHIRSDRDFSDIPFLNSKGYEGTEDAWKDKLYEIARQGEARGQDVNNGLARLMGGYCSMTDKDTASVVLSSHAEILHELHNAAMEEEGWNDDNGFVNAATKGYKVKALVSGTYGTDDFDAKILSVKRNTHADFKPLDADLEDDSVVATWKPKSPKPSSNVNCYHEPNHKISASTICDMSTILSSWLSKDKASAAKADGDTASEGEATDTSLSIEDRDAELRSVLQTWIDSEASALPKDGYSLRNPSRFARNVMANANTLTMTNPTLISAA